MLTLRDTRSIILIGGILKMRRESKRNKIIIFILAGIVCLMGIGYAAFQTQLEISAVGNISGEWKVRITNVEVTEEHGSGVNKDFSFEDTSANLEADLYSKGDYVVYLTSGQF